MSKASAEGSAAESSVDRDGLNKTGDILQGSDSWDDILNDSYGHKPAISLHASHVTKANKDKSITESFTGCVFLSMSSDFLKAFSIAGSSIAGRSSEMSGLLDENENENKDLSSPYPPLTEETLRQHDEQKKEVFPKLHQSTQSNAGSSSSMSSSEELRGSFDFQHKSNLLERRREIRGGFGTPSSYASEQEMNLYFDDFGSKLKDDSLRRNSLPNTSTGNVDFVVPPTNESFVANDEADETKCKLMWTAQAEKPENVDKNCVVEKFEIKVFAEKVREVVPEITDEEINQATLKSTQDPTEVLSPPESHQQVELFDGEDSQRNNQTSKTSPNLENQEIKLSDKKEAILAEEFKINAEESTPNKSMDCVDYPLLASEKYEQPFRKAQFETATAICFDITPEQSDAETFEHENDDFNALSCQHEDPLPRMLKTAKEAVITEKKGEELLRSITEQKFSEVNINNSPRNENISPMRYSEGNVHITEILCLNNGEMVKNTNVDDAEKFGIPAVNSTAISSPCNQSSIQSKDENSVESITDSLIEDIFDTSVAELRKEIERNKNIIAVPCIIDEKFVATSCDLSFEVVIPEEDDDLVPLSHEVKDTDFLPKESEEQPCGDEFVVPTENIPNENVPCVVNVVTNMVTEETIVAKAKTGLIGQWSDISVDELMSIRNSPMDTQNQTNQENEDVQVENQEESLREGISDNQLEDLNESLSEDKSMNQCLETTMPINNDRTFDEMQSNSKPSVVSYQDHTKINGNNIKIDIQRANEISTEDIQLSQVEQPFMLEHGHLVCHDNPLKPESSSSSSEDHASKNEITIEEGDDSIKKEQPKYANSNEIEEQYLQKQDPILHNKTEEKRAFLSADFQDDTDSGHDDVVDAVSLEISNEVIHLHVDSFNEVESFKSKKLSEEGKNDIVEECISTYGRKQKDLLNISSLLCDTDGSSEYFSLPDPEVNSIRGLSNKEVHIVESDDTVKENNYKVEPVKNLHSFQNSPTNKEANFPENKPSQSEFDHDGLSEKTKEILQRLKANDKEYFDKDSDNITVVHEQTTKSPDVANEQEISPILSDDKEQWLLRYAPTYQAVLEWDQDGLPPSFATDQEKLEVAKKDSVKEKLPKEDVFRIEFEPITPVLAVHDDSFVNIHKTECCYAGISDTTISSSSYDLVSERGSYISGDVVDSERDEFNRIQSEEEFLSAKIPSNELHFSWDPSFGSKKQYRKQFNEPYVDFKSNSAKSVYVSKYQDLDKQVVDLLSTATPRKHNQFHNPTIGQYRTNSSPTSSKSPNLSMSSYTNELRNQMTSTPITTSDDVIDHSTSYAMKLKVVKKIKRERKEIIRNINRDVIAMREELHQQRAEITFSEQTLRIWREYCMTRLPSSTQKRREKNPNGTSSSSSLGKSRILQDEIDSFKNEIRQRESEIDGLVKLLREAKEKNRIIETKLHDSYVDEHRINHLKQEKKEFYDKIRYQKDEISKLKDKVVSLTREREIATANERLAKEDLKTEQDIRSVLRSSPTESSYDRRKTIENLRERVKDLEEQNRCSSSELNRAEYLLDSLKGENRDLRRSKEDEIGELKRENEKMRETLDKVNDLSAENLLLASDSADLQGELTELRKEARDLRSRCYELSEDNRQLKMEVRDLRRYIDAMNKNKPTDVRQDLVDKIEYYQSEHDRLLDEVKRLKIRLGEISPRSRSPAVSPRCSPRSSPVRSRGRSMNSSSPCKGVRFDDMQRERSATSDCLAAATAAGMAVHRVDDGRMSPSLALNFKDLTMDRYKQHMDGGRDADGRQSPDSIDSDNTELLLNSIPAEPRSRDTKRSTNDYGSYSGYNGRQSGSSPGRSRDKSRSPSPALGGAGYRSISPRQTSTQRNRPKTTEYPPEINRSLPRRAFAPRSPADLKNGYAIKFTRPGGKISRGTVKYIGNLPARDGVYLGVELDGHDGKHCGTFQGSKYFSCPPNKGVFTPFGKVIMAWE